MQAVIVNWPFAERFHLMMPHFSGLHMCALGPPEVTGWVRAMQQRSTSQTAAAEPNAFLRAVKEHQSLDFFDYVPYHARDLHPHLTIARS